MRCPCSVCDGRGEVVGKYVLCEGFYDGIVAEADNLESLVSTWKGSGLSLRVRTVDGQVIDVSTEDYQRASDLVHGRKVAAPAPGDKQGPA